MISCNVWGLELDFVKEMKEIQVNKLLKWTHLWLIQKRIQLPDAFLDSSFQNQGHGIVKFKGGVPGKPPYSLNCCHLHPVEVFLPSIVVDSSSYQGVCVSHVVQNLSFLKCKKKNLKCNMWDSE